MTSRSFPRRPRAPLAVAALAAAFALSARPALVHAQEPTPGTPDATFAIDRLRNVTFIPSQTNFTPFALALQPGQDPVLPTSPSVREVPASQTKLLIGGDATTLFRVFLTETVRVTTSYDDNGVPVVSYTAPFEPGDYDPIFFASPASSNGFGDGGRITYALSVNADGGVLVGGHFDLTGLSTSVFAKQEKNFILLNFNGDTEITNNLDADGNVTSQTQGPFNTNVGAGANDSVLAILRRSTVVPGENDGRILLGGQFIRFNKQNESRVVQLLPDGTLDVDFNRNLGSGANATVFSLAEAVGPAVDAFGLGGFNAPNGQVYVCGDFDRFNGQGPGKLVRLNADGTLDPDFAPNIVGRAIAVAVQPDGKVLVGGDLDTINNTAVTNLARLNPDGTLDTVFLANATVSLASPQYIPPTSVYVLRVQGDGRILVGGNFLLLDGTTRRYLGRLNADGTLDTTFDAGSTLNQATQSVVYVPRDTSLGRATDLIYAQTRADRKQVPGDNGYFPAPVRRLFGDDTSGNFVAQPVGAPLVRIGADGPTATPGDLTTRPDLADQPVLNPGTPGLFRITREGDTTNDLTVIVKVLPTSAGGEIAAGSSVAPTFALRQLVFTTTTDTSTSTPTTTVTTTDAGLTPVIPGSKNFNVTIPAGKSSASIIVNALGNPAVDANNVTLNTVTLKLKAAADGSYSRRADQQSATVTLLSF